MLEPVQVHYASSRNHVVNGLYTQNAFVLPDEGDVYRMFCLNIDGACKAVGAGEESLAAEITSAAWRLRRCNLADGEVAEHSTFLSRQVPDLSSRRAAQKPGRNRGDCVSYTTRSREAEWKPRLKARVPCL